MPRVAQRLRNRLSVRDAHCTMWASLEKRFAELDAKDKQVRAFFSRSYRVKGGSKDAKGRPMKQKKHRFIDVLEDSVAGQFSAKQVQDKLEEEERQNDLFYLSEKHDPLMQPLFLSGSKDPLWHGFGTSDRLSHCLRLGHSPMDTGTGTAMDVMPGVRRSHSAASTRNTAGGHHGSGHRRTRPAPASAPRLRQQGSDQAGLQANLLKQCERGASVPADAMLAGAPPVARLAPSPPTEVRLHVPPPRSASAQPAEPSTSRSAGAATGDRCDSAHADLPRRPASAAGVPGHRRAGSRPSSASKLHRQVRGLETSTWQAIDEDFLTRLEQDVRRRSARSTPRTVTPTAPMTPMTPTPPTPTTTLSASPSMSGMLTPPGWRNDWHSGSTAVLRPDSPIHSDAISNLRDSSSSPNLLMTQPHPPPPSRRHSRAASSASARSAGDLSTQGTMTSPTSAASLRHAEWSRTGSQRDLLGGFGGAGAIGSQRAQPHGPGSASGDASGDSAIQGRNDEVDIDIDSDELNACAAPRLLKIVSVSAEVGESPAPRPVSAPVLRAWQRRQRSNAGRGLSARPASAVPQMQARLRLMLAADKAVKEEDVVDGGNRQASLCCSSSNGSGVVGASSGGTGYETDEATASDVVGAAGMAADSDADGGIVQSIHVHMPPAPLPRPLSATTIRPVEAATRGSHGRERLSRPSSAVSLHRSSGSRQSRSSRRSSRSQPTSRQYYNLTVQISAASDVTSWLFDVYLTDITAEETPTLCYKAMHVTADRMVVFRPDLRGPEAVVLSPVDAFPWVDEPIELANHSLRIEVYARQPVTQCVADSIVRFGPDTQTPTDEAAGAGAMVPPLSLPPAPRLSQHADVTTVSEGEADPSGASTPLSMQRIGSPLTPVQRKNQQDLTLAALRQVSLPVTSPSSATAGTPPPCAAAAGSRQRPSSAEALRLLRREMADSLSSAKARLETQVADLAGVVQASRPRGSMQTTRSLDQLPKPTPPPPLSIRAMASARPATTGRGRAGKQLQRARSAPMMRQIAPRHVTSEELEQRWRKDSIAVRLDARLIPGRHRKT